MTDTYSDNKPGDNMNQPIRVVSRGMFGTVVDTKHGDVNPVRPGVLLDVIWIDFPDDGSDEIDGSNLCIVTEATFQIEMMERKIDAKA